MSWWLYPTTHDHVHQHAHAKRAPSGSGVFEDSSQQKGQQLSDSHFRIRVSATLRCLDEGKLARPCPLLGCSDRRLILHVRFATTPLVKDRGGIIIALCVDVLVRGGCLTAT